jgi:multiple sugar transport system substrate-binding protein
MTWRHDRGERSIVESSREWSRRHPDVAFTWESRSLLDFGDQPLSELAGEYDLLVIDHPHVAEAAAGGLLAAFDSPPDPTDFEGRSQPSYTWNGRCWGLAIDAATQVSLHRPDLLAEGPVDWDGVIALAREGRVIWAGKPVDAYASLFTLVAGVGGSDPARGGVFCDEDVFDEAWSVLRGLADAVPERSFESNPIDVAETLATSDEFAYCPLAYGYTNYSRAGYRPHLVRYRDIPFAPGTSEPRGSMLGGAGITVSAASAHVKEAQEFALWAATAEVQAGIYFDAGGQPGHAAAWADPRLDSLTDGFFSGTGESMRRASHRPGHPAYMELQNAGSREIWTALREKSDGRRVLARLNELTARMEEAS